MKKSNDVNKALELLPEGFSLEGWQDIHVTSSNLISAIIPTDLINNPEPPLDDDNYEKLAKRYDAMVKQNKGYHGQLTPISTGIVIDRGNDHEIIDGFHRDALMARRVGSIMCLVVPRILWNDLLEQRITAAVPHPSLQYARVVRWSRDLWESTPWSDSMSVIDAFRFTVGESGRSKGTLNGDNKDIHKWVTDKSRAWDLDPKDVLKYLRSAEAFDDEILELIRTGNGFTLEKALVVADTFPDETDIQLVAANAISKHRYSLPKVRQLVGELELAKTVDEAEEISNNAAFYLKGKGSKPSSSGKSGNGGSLFSGIPRMRTFTELIDELNMRRGELDSLVADAERIAEIDITITTLLEWVNSHVDDVKSAKIRDELEQPSTIPTFATEEERRANYEFVLDNFLNALSTYCPPVEDAWQAMKMRQAVIKMTRSDTTEVMKQRLEVCNRNLYIYIQNGRSALHIAKN